MFNLIDDDVEIYNYADDNTILCSGKCLTDIKARLLDNVNILIGWYHENNMIVNSEKFQCIIFGNGTPLLHVILIIVVHYGIFVPMLIHLKSKKIQKRALRYVSRQMTSPYEELLQICQKSPLYIVR